MRVIALYSSDAIPHRACTTGLYEALRPQVDAYDFAIRDHRSYGQGQKSSIVVLPPVYYGVNHSFINSKLRQRLLHTVLFCFIWIICQIC